MQFTRQLDHAMDKLANTSPIWSPIKTSTSEFKKTSKPQKIKISMADLNQLIFRRNHYHYDCNNGGGHSYQGNNHNHGVTINTKRKGTIRIITATLENSQGIQKINMTFCSKNGQCTLTKGQIDKNGVIESLQDSKLLSEILLCIYKHVRITADPKWATRYLMEKEAREIAAQPMTLETFPTVINNGGQLVFKKPSAEGRCGNICGQGFCPAKTMLKTLSPTN